MNVFQLTGFVIVSLEVVKHLSVVVVLESRGRKEVNMRNSPKTCSATVKFSKTFSQKLAMQLKVIQMWKNFSSPQDIKFQSSNLRHHFELIEKWFDNGNYNEKSMELKTVCEVSATFLFTHVSRNSSLCKQKWRNLYKNLMFSLRLFPSIMKIKHLMKLITWVYINSAGRLSKIIWAW